MRWSASLVLVALIATLASGASAQVAQQHPVSHLTGLRMVSLWVAVSAAEPAPLTNERLRQASEQRIRLAGLQVMPVPIQPAADSAAFVEISVVIADIRSATQKFGYAVWTSVKAGAGPSTVLWERGRLNVCELPDAQQRIEAAARELLDEFLADWRTANPKG